MDRVDYTGPPSLQAYLEEEYGERRKRYEYKQEVCGVRVLCGPSSVHFCAFLKYGVALNGNAANTYREGNKLLASYLQQASYYTVLY